MRHAVALLLLAACSPTDPDERKSGAAVDTAASDGDTDGGDEGSGRGEDDGGGVGGSGDDGDGDGDDDTGGDDDGGDRPSDRVTGEHAYDYDGLDGGTSDDGIVVEHALRDGFALTDWNIETRRDGDIMLWGVVENVGLLEHPSVRMQVEAYGADGTLLAEGDTRVYAEVGKSVYSQNNMSLWPGGRGLVRAPISGVLRSDIARLAFHFTWYDLEVSRPDTTVELNTATLDVTVDESDKLVYTGHLVNTGGEAAVVGAFSIKGWVRNADGDLVGHINEKLLDEAELLEPGASVAVQGRSYLDAPTPSYTVEWALDWDDPEFD